MISWIQRNFQRHFRTVFGVVLGVMIISFIFTIGSTPGIGRGDRRTLAHPFFGYNLESQSDQSRIFGDGQLSVLLHYGRALSMNSPQLEQLALRRTATLALADQFQIPAPSDEALASYIKTLRAFAGQDGEFDASRYSSFRENQLWAQLNPRMTTDDVKRVFIDDWRVTQVDKLLAGPGYVLPGDVKTQLALADTQWTIAVASADYAKYAPVIDPTPAELKKFFEEKSSNYEIPPRVSVDYIAFSADDFISKVTVTGDEVRAYYDAHPGQFPKPADHNKTPAKPNPDADFAAVRPQVEAALKIDHARQLAAQAASDVALDLYNTNIDSISPRLDSFLAEHHLALKSLAPFAADTPPAELGTSPEIANEAARLGKDHFCSDALVTPKGSVILLWKENLPAYTPLLAEVLTKVTADYKEGQRRKLFEHVLGKSIHDQLTARLKAGDTFDKAVAITSVTASITAAPAAGVSLVEKTYPSFTLRQPPKDLADNLLEGLDRLKTGTVSDMIFSDDKGWFVYVAAKKLPDLSETGPRFSAARARLAPMVAEATLNGSVAEIVSREQKKSAPANLP